MTDNSICKLLDCICGIIKWFSVQALLLFFMPYLGKDIFNLTTFALVFLYTSVYVIFWNTVPKNKRFNWLLYPYIGYVSLILVLKTLINIGIFTKFALTLSWLTLVLPVFGAMCVILVRLYRKISQQIRKKYTCGWIFTYSLLILFFFCIKSLSVSWECSDHESPETERIDIMEREAYLLQKIIISPEQLLNAMPSSLGMQFQGEWAIYSCSMLSAALVNISHCYPETRLKNLEQIDCLIRLVMSPEIRRYDMVRWDEDPLESLDGNESHVSYLSHLAWMISGYKQLGGDNRYNKLFDILCEAMNRRLLNSKCFNLSTYPGEPIYIPDMLVAIVALHNYADLNKGKYQSTVDRWIDKAKREWIDSNTGLLLPFLQENGTPYEDTPVKGSYAALSCYYLTLIDDNFARSQYEKLKALCWKNGLVPGLKEYNDRNCLVGLDVDAGPILVGLSPSGTAFCAGIATYFNDYDIRNKILRTAEIAGHTIHWSGSRHYLLADLALVGEAIMLAMRTNYANFNKIHA